MNELCSATIPEGSYWNDPDYPSVVMYVVDEWVAGAYHWSLILP
jgi:hypothetical protein